MESPELYAINNSITRDGATSILDELWPRLTWSEDGEKVLDIGSGPGDITSDILLPRLPAHATVVGVDVSSNMTKYAKSKCSNDRIHFLNIDFLTQNITESLEEKSFSKIFSFYALQFMKDQRQVAKNIFNLLRADGQFVIMFVSPKAVIFTVFKHLAQMDKWKDFMKDLYDIYYLSENACENIKKIWSSEGLDVEICEERRVTFPFKDMKSYIEMFDTVNPFINLMDQDTHKQHMKDFQRIVEEKKLVKETPTGEILYPSDTVVIYGRKSV